MEVLIHSPVPAAGGSRVSGSGRSPMPETETSGTTGRLNITVTAPLGSISTAAGAGCT